jgi:nodulation protein F
MKDPSKAVTLETPLSELEIESLDLAVIVFDIEDTFGIEIPYNANEEVEAFATVGSVVDRVQSIISSSKDTGAAA